MITYEASYIYNVIRQILYQEVVDSKLKSLSKTLNMSIVDRKYIKVGQLSFFILIKLRYLVYME